MPKINKYWNLAADKKGSSSWIFFFLDFSYSSTTTLKLFINLDHHKNYLEDKKKRCCVPASAAPIFIFFRHHTPPRCLLCLFGHFSSNNKQTQQHIMPHHVCFSFLAQTPSHFHLTALNKHSEIKHIRIIDISLFHRKKRYEIDRITTGTMRCWCVRARVDELQAKKTSNCTP